MPIDSAYYVKIKNNDETVEQVISLDYNTGINYIERWAEKCKARLTKLCSTYGLITIEIPEGRDIIYTYTITVLSVLQKPL